jgi:hypothetical protein
MAGVDVLLVWSPATLVAAALGGFGFGFLIIGPLSERPLFVSSASAGQLAVLVGGLAAFGMLVFFAGQAGATAAEGDTLWPRVISRAGLAVVYGVAIGIGLYASVRGAHRRRHKRAVATARQQLAAAPKRPPYGPPPM